MNRLDEIAGRLEAATPGPWTVDVQGPDWARVTTPSGGALGCGDAVGDASFFTRDADLIAHAPADLAALLGVVRTVAELADDLAASPAEIVEAARAEWLRHCLPANAELMFDGREDRETAAYVAGEHAAYDAVPDIIAASWPLIARRVLEEAAESFTEGGMVRRRLEELAAAALAPEGRDGEGA